MRELTHGQMVKIEGRYGRVGTVHGCAAEWRYTEERAKSLVERSRARGDAMAWVIQETVAIHNNPRLYELQQKRHAEAVEIAPGELVRIEGKTWTTMFNGNFSNMVHFVELVEAEEVADAA